MAEEDYLDEEFEGSEEEQAVDSASVLAVELAAAENRLAALKEDHEKQLASHQEKFAFAGASQEIIVPSRISAALSQHEPEVEKLPVAPLTQHKAREEQPVDSQVAEEEAAGKAQTDVEALAKREAEEQAARETVVAEAEQRAEAEAAAAKAAEEAAANQRADEEAAAARAQAEAEAEAAQAAAEAQKEAPAAAVPAQLAEETAAAKARAGADALAKQEAALQDNKSTEDSGLPVDRDYAVRASEIVNVAEEAQELVRLESEHLANVSDHDFGWSYPTIAGAKEDRTIWCGGIPAGHPRLSELELRRYFSSKYGAVESLNLRTKTVKTDSTGIVDGDYRGSWCVVTFESKVACTRALESGVDLDDGLRNREGCALVVRRSDQQKLDHNGYFSNDNGALVPRDERLVADLSACKSLYDDGNFDQAVTKLTLTIENFKLASDQITMTSKEKTVLGACYALRGQCYEELGGPGCRQQAAQDYTAAIALDSEADDADYDVDWQLPHALEPPVPNGKLAVVPAVSMPLQVPTPKPRGMPNFSAKAPSGNAPTKRRSGKSGNASKRSSQAGVAGAAGSVVGSHTPTFHPLTSTHGRYPRVPMAVMPPSPRAVKTQRAAEAVRLNGNRVATDRPVCPARAEVKAKWDRPSAFPAHTRGTFGTSYTVPRIPAQKLPADSRSTTPRGATDAFQETAGTTPEQDAEAGVVQRRTGAMARLCPPPVADFKPPALQLKGRNMKEAAQDLPDGHFVVGGRVYKLADTAGDDKPRGGDVGSSEAMQKFLERKHPDEVPPWHQHGSDTAPDLSGVCKTNGAKQQWRRRGLVPEERGAQGRAQQLGPFGSGRGSDADAGGRPWSAVEPTASQVNPRALSTAVSHKHVESGGWMWRPLSQGGPIVAAFGE